VPHIIFVLVLALIVDATIGDPDWLWRRLPHPVVLFGWLIEGADKIGNKTHFSPLRRRFNGFVALIILLFVAGFVGWGLGWLCQQGGTVGLIIEAVIASLFLAQRSLSLHVKAVYLAYKNDGLKGARGTVRLIVGRDPDSLDEAGICRAAIESLSENSSDGVIAPAFWFLLAGLPGIMVYKMLNTADSMIGHKNARYGDFGFGAARLDDVANLLPARLTTLLIAIAAWGLWGKPQAKAAILTSMRDAQKHCSPNAGWPESAYAGALGISLAGPRSYGAQKITAPFQNEAGRVPAPTDILQALNLFWGSMVVFWVFLLAFLSMGVFLT